jgi:hypothetical protein
MEINGACNGLHFILVVYALIDLNYLNIELIDCNYLFQYANFIILDCTIKTYKNGKRIKRHQ